MSKNSQNKLDQISLDQSKNEKSKTENPKTDIKLKIKTLEEIRQDIKKKRVIFDEHVERFGLSELTQLVKVKNTSEVKGYPFKGSGKITKNKNIALKLIPIETKYEKDQHPSNLEIIVLKYLTDNIVNKMISPHITHYLGVQKVNNKYI